MKDPVQTSKRVKESHRHLQALAENYKADRIDIELQHAKALKKLEKEYAERSKSLQGEIESIRESLAS